MIQSGFNKKDFAELLKIAKGRRSINKYGNDSGVDPGYISRLMRGLIDAPPSASVISKLASKAHNNITVDKFMIAAGYLEDDRTINDQAKDAVNNPKYAHLPPEKKKIIDDMIDALSED